MMRRLILLGATALALMSCAVGGNSPRRYALVYGVSWYDAGWISNLHYSDDDADSVAAMLSGAGFDTVIKRTSNDAGVLYPAGQGPTKANIVSDLSALASTIGPDDLLVFYFSGHGTQNTEEWFIPLYGADSSGFYPANSISTTGLSDMLAAIPTTRKVVILDSCYSGGFVGNPLETDRTPPDFDSTRFILSPQTISAAVSNYFNFPAVSQGITPYGNAMVISATGRNDVSFEDPSFQHGIFTYYLLEARDLNGDGFVTAAEAFSIVKAGIETVWNRDPGVILMGWQFEPHISGGPVDFVLF